MKSTSVLGSIGELDPTTSTIMIIVIVVSVLLVDGAFNLLRDFTRETPFIHIISALERELMIVGFTAFVFRLIFSSGSSSILTESEYMSLEFADLLIPLFSMCNCIIGMAMIYMSVKQSIMWSRAFHLKLEMLVDEFFDITEKLIIPM
jgi:hypothetical protein